MNLYQLPELNELIALVARYQDIFKTYTLATVPFKDRDFPVFGLSMGSESPEAPVLILVGGIHGLERIGSRVILTYLHSLAQRLRWGKSLQSQLREIRIISIRWSIQLECFWNGAPTATGRSDAKRPVNSNEALFFLAVNAWVNAFPSTEAKETLDGTRASGYLSLFKKRSLPVKKRHHFRCSLRFWRN
jgi:hypothetical protein